MHGFIFTIIFPSWDRNRCFPSFLMLPKARSAGQSGGDGSFPVFSHGRVRLVTLPGSSTAAPEAELGHPYFSLPTCIHFPPQDQGPRRPDDGGAGFSLRLRKTWCPSANGVHMTYSGSKGLCSQAQLITQTGLEGAWPQPYIHRHKTSLPLPLSLNILLYTANCALWHNLRAEKKWSNKKKPSWLAKIYFLSGMITKTTEWKAGSRKGKIHTRLYKTIWQ